MNRLLLLSLLLLGGVSGCKKAETPTSPTPPSNNVLYTAIGASDGLGIGSSVECVIFDPDCPSGRGYVYLLKRRFQADGRSPVSYTHLTLPTKRIV